MNDRRDLDTRVADWVADLPSRAPDDTLDRVLAELPTLPQSGRLPAALRRTLMNTSARGARASYTVPLAAAAVLVVAVVAAGMLLSRGPGTGGFGAAPPSPTPAVTPAASASAPASADASTSPSLPPARGVESTVIDVPGAGELAVGPVGPDGTPSQTVWATSSDGVIAIDAATNEVVPVEIAVKSANGIRATDETVWISDLDGFQAFRLKLGSDAAPEAIPLNGVPYAIEVIGDEVLVTFEGQTDVLDAETNEVLRTYQMPGSFPNAVAFGYLWVIEEDAVLRVDPGTGDVLATIDIANVPDTCSLWPLSGVEGIGDSIVLGCFDGQYLTRIDVATDAVAGTYNVGPNGGSAIAVGGAWWSPVGPVDDGGLGRIDPATGQVVELVDLGAGNGPSGMVTTDDALWVAVEARNTVLRIPISSLQAP